MPEETVPTGTTDAEAVTLTPAELEERINAAREQAAKDEREKLYGRLNADKKEEGATLKELRAELSTLTKAQKVQEAEREKLTKAREAEERKRQEAELSAKDLIAKREAEWEDQRVGITREWETKFTALNENLASERAIREREQEYSKLAAYIQRRVAEEAETIEPHLVKYVQGASPEEVELSIKQLQADSAGIYQTSAEHFRGARAAMPGSAPTGNTPAGPLDDQQRGNQEYTAEDIKAMSMPEYAEFRKQAGVANSGNGRGLYQ